MQGLDLVAGFAKALAEFFGHHHASVLAAGAAEGDGQVAFALFDVMREQVEHELGDTIEELSRLRESADVGGDFRIEAGLLAEFGDEVGVGQEANIENHIGVEGHAILEAETETGNEEALGLLLVAEAGVNVGAELVDVEVGSVNERVGDVANGIEELTLFDDGAPDGFRLAEGMRAACFRVPADEHGVLSVEIDDAGLKKFLDALEDFREAIESGALANVHDDSGAFDLNGFTDDRGELREQFEGQIVDAVVSQILKGLKRRSFACAGDSSEDDKLLGRFACRLRLAACYLRLASCWPRFWQSGRWLRGRHWFQCYTGIRGRLKMGKRDAGAIR